MSGQINERLVSKETELPRWSVSRWYTKNLISNNLINVKFPPRQRSSRFEPILTKLETSPRCMEIWPLFTHLIPNFSARPNMSDRATYRSPCLASHIFKEKLEL